MILLILPCMPWTKYGLNFASKGRLWRILLRRIQNWRSEIDVYAIDCIRLKSTSHMIGLWSPFSEIEIFQEIVQENLDSYPSWTKYKNHPELVLELLNRVEITLESIACKYERIIAFINVRAYRECLENIAPKYRIKMLPVQISWRTPQMLTNNQFDELPNFLGQMVLSNAFKGTELAANPPTT